MPSFSFTHTQTQTEILVRWGLKSCSQRNKDYTKSLKRKPRLYNQYNGKWTSQWYQFPKIKRELGLGYISGMSMRYCI